MVPMMSIKRAAAIWSLSERRVNELCKTGRIAGAYKEEGRWKIPANSKKPVDERYKVKLPPAIGSTRKLPLPVGISDYKRLVTDYYYVDKTLLLKEIIDEKAPLSLFARPRCFGKSVNMDMIRTFFEMSHEDNSVYFKNRKIWECGEDYRIFQGKFPTIFLDFHSVRYEKWEQTFDRLKKLISDEFSRHREILDSERCTQIDKDSFNMILLGRADDEEYKSSLRLLTKVLDEHYSVPPVVIIDEYDTPVKSGIDFRYRDDVESFMRGFMTQGLQDNRHVSYAFLAGILCLVSNSILSDLSNIKVNSVLDRKYGEYFGFTEEEVLEMVDYYDASTKENEIRNWYGSYHFGEADVYNPWSVVNYFNDECRPLAFWEMTGDNHIIDDFLAGASLDMLDKLETMMQNKSFGARVYAGVTTPDRREDPAALFSYMLATGYLKIADAELQFDGDYMCHITMPNRELSFMYGKRILKQFESIIPKSTAMAVRETLYKGDVEELREHIYKFIRQTISFSAQGSDKIFYHGLVLGLCAMLGNRYYMSTETEEQTGSFSIEMMPLEVRLPGILIMTKAAERAGGQQLDALARFACKQIANRQYETEAKNRYISSALKYGVAYSGTAISIVCE